MGRPLVIDSSKPIGIAPMRRIREREWLMHIQDSNQIQLVQLWGIEQVRPYHANYLRFLKIKRRSEAHRDRVNRSLIHFEKWLAGIDSPRLTQELIEDYALWLMEEACPHAGSLRQGAPGTLAVASQRGYLVDLRSFLRWCADRGFVPVQVKSWVPVPAAPKHGIKRAQNSDWDQEHHMKRHFWCELIIG